jgi:hydrogenase nickel incorporation protein HypB
MQIVLAKRILHANDRIAQDNRGKFDAAGVLAVNVLGSPGAGKTALLEAILPILGERCRAAVIEGDLATSRDAERIEAVGVPCVQINTDGGCHLDAGMVASAMDALDLAALDVLFIENVGNLVCTAGFDLGESLRIVVLSVAEGDDKVEKYPPMFSGVDAVFLNKIDLLPHTDFDPERVQENLRRLSPEASILRVSARTGEGVGACAEWILGRRKPS